jgi:hypothetical protein
MMATWLYLSRTSAIDGYTYDFIRVTLHAREDRRQSQQEICLLVYLPQIYPVGRKQSNFLGECAAGNGIGGFRFAKTHQI